MKGVQISNVGIPGGRTCGSYKKGVTYLKRTRTEFRKGDKKRKKYRFQNFNKKVEYVWYRFDEIVTKLLSDRKQTTFAEIQVNRMYRTDSSEYRAPAHLKMKASLIFGNAVCCSTLARIFKDRQGRFPDIKFILIVDGVELQEASNVILT